MAYDLIKISALPETTPDESQDIVIGEGDYAKRINYGDVKADMVGAEPLYTTDTEPYLMRQTANIGIVGKCALEKLVGGSLGWNQLCKYPPTQTVSGVTITNNGTKLTLNGTANALITLSLDTLTIPTHIYYADKGSSATNYRLYNYGNGVTTGDEDRYCFGKASGSAALTLRIPSGSTFANLDIVPQAIDLTQMFGPTIADYIYSLEQATAGSGIAWLSKYIDLDTYYAHDAGSIQSVQATAHVTTGFNQFDEVVEAGYWDISTGQKASGGNWMRCANYIPVLPNTEYKIHFTSGSGSQGSLIYLNGNKAVISYVSSYISAVVTTPTNCRYIVFYANSGWFGGNICINISKTTGSPKNGDYVPYNGHSYPLGSDTLRGYPMLVNNKLAFDGDIKIPDGTIRRRYGIVDLGTLTWSYQSNTGMFYSGGYADMKAGTIKGIVSNGYKLVSGTSAVQSTDKTICKDSNGRLYAHDSAYSTAAAFQTAISGTYMVYEKNSETSESSTAYQKVQTIDADGTESFTTSSPVPVGHETQTPNNVLAALGWLGE